jgi:hypothetical protein
MNAQPAARPSEQDDHPAGAGGTNIPLPPAETKQPDPMLQLSVGRIGSGGLALIGVVVAIVLGVVFYGLNGPTRPEPNTPAAVTHNMMPQSGGNSGAAAPSAPRANESGTKG